MIIMRRSKIPLRSIWRQYSSSQSDSVLSSVEGGVGRITLNRPKALNALTLDMIRSLTPLLRSWADPGSGVKMVIVRGAGDKAFCAGGDIKAITEVPGGQIQRDFFREEYQLDHLVGTLSIPYISILNGITMGGGVGISVNGRYRVATEKSVFAMPENAIGLVPDVGGGYFLPRMSGELGMFLGLTGHRLKGWDCLSSGVATHAVRLDQMENLYKELEGVGKEEDIQNVLDHFVPIEAKEHKFSLADQMEDINRIFGGDSVESIVENLLEENSDIARKALKGLAAASPTSLKVAFRQLRTGKDMDSLGEVLKMEHRLVTRCYRDKDFYEGVRATLVDRDNKPAWQPPTLAEVSEERVNFYFSPLEEDVELKL